MKKGINLKKTKILLTGGSGFLGFYVKRELMNKGVKEKNILIPRSKRFDLRDRENCILVTRNVDVVIHLAGNVGGIGKNSALPGLLFYDNAVMGIELMEAARLNKVKKFITVGTVCAYPKFVATPFKEKDLWLGYPEETNAAYGLAKKMLLVQGQAYRTQYKFNAIYLLLVNLYGPRDNFDLNTSHVIPALVRKISQAKANKTDEVIVWGSGSPSREFLFVEDAARAIVAATKYYNKRDPVNIGANFEIKIKDLLRVLCGLMGYKGKVKWDKSKPDGQPRRKLDTSKAKREFGFEAKVQFEKGLIETIEWFYKNYKT